MNTDKDLFRLALGHYICNADEVFDDVFENDDWGEVIIWQPFEQWEINDIHSEVLNLQQDFINVRDNVMIY